MRYVLLTIRAWRDFVRRAIPIGLVTFGLVFGMSDVAVAASGDPTGEQIYRQKCVACHGANGDGSEDYPRQLAGDRSVAQLSKLIAKTMPEDDPGTCVGGDADKVAAYIYETFYSKAAQAKNKPPRIELSRLTVRQYRNAVAEIFGSFRSAPQTDGKRGLHAEYFKTRRFRTNERLIDRLDPTVQFDFGDKAPDPEKFDAHEFSIRWEGSLLAPETGEYEFIVRADHATRLWLNDPNLPLIDATVRSGNDNEYRASIFLLGGRSYHLKLEFSKAKQGVDDSKKTKELPPVKASISLSWKLPHRPEEVIPERNLTPARSPELFVATTPFPPDDRSVGYERGTSISKAWDQATTDAAIEISAYTLSHLRELSGTRSDDPDRNVKLRDFCSRFAERAFRRPLSDEQKTLYIARQFDEAPDLEAAVKRCLLFILKSPRFLYREVTTEPDLYDIASRLSFGLWDSLPDSALLEAAAAGKLANRDEVSKQAERMLVDPRAKSKLREFFLMWLRVEHVPDLSKDPDKLPGFDLTIASDLRTSLGLFLDDVLGGEASDFRQILLADTIYLNGRLAKFYGVDLPADAPFQKVSLEPKERAGVLTHPYLMSTFAYTATSSPIHRGVFISRSVLGRSLRPPPEAVAPLPVDLHPDLTTRERVTLQTKPESCTTCHGRINPLGFGLEHFDAVGRYRSEERGRSIDASGTFETRSGDTVKFTGARELATLLAESDETHAAFVAQLFHHMMKQSIRAYGPREAPELTKSFAKNGFNIRGLMVEIMASTALKKS
jgi:cytochrome c553